MCTCIPSTTFQDHYRDKALTGGANLAVSVAQFEGAGLEVKQGGVAPGADAQGADIRLADNTGGDGGDFGNYVVERQAEVEELGGGGREIVDRAVDVVDMQVAGDGLGEEALGQSGLR